VQWNYDVVGTTHDEVELAQEVRRCRPDVLVADVDVPGMNFHEAVRRLTSVDRLGAKMVFLTMHADPELAEEAFRAGGAGYVLKQSARSELHLAIQEVLEGRSYLASHITNRVFAALASSGMRRVDLTRRQRELLRLTAQGRRDQDIAAILNVPAWALEAEREKVLDDLGLESGADVSRYAIDNGLAVH
jgi:DNA-binding NarL/FixJ family response regulator